VFLDLGMPGMDGYEIARRIRARADGRAISLVALTGWNQEVARRRTREIGFDGHLSKPADVDALLAMLAGLRETRTVPALQLAPAAKREA
jgi:CheY-like chemotaxis protein